MITKLTILLLLACLADVALRRAPAALRHLMWTLTVVCSLLLPLGELYAPRIAGEAFVIHASGATGRIVAEALSTPTNINWLIAIYLTGVAFLLVRLTLDILAANRLLMGSRASSLPGVRISEQATVPFAWGSIVVPPGFEGRAAVLAHEAAHLERGDVWTSILARVACAIYWFHPLIWWANMRMRLEADRACDDAVLRRGFSDASYAEDLVEVARSFAPAGLAPGAVNQSQLHVRVRHILATGVNRRSLGTAATCVAVVASIAVVSPLAAITQRPNEPVFRVGHGVTAPSVLYKVDPEYSREARKAKLQATVLVSVVIGSDGLAHNIQVVRHAGMGLDEKAIEGVRKWRFKPGTRDGRPVSVLATIEVNFRLL
jgi:TonB family protein